MYCVRYTVNDSDKVLCAFVNTNNPEEAKRLVFNCLKAENYSTLLLQGVEKTSMNVFIEPRACILAF